MQILELGTNFKSKSAAQFISSLESSTHHFKHVFLIFLQYESISYVHHRSRFICCSHSFEMLEQNLIAQCREQLVSSQVWPHQHRSSSLQFSFFFKPFSPTMIQRFHVATNINETNVYKMIACVFFFHFEWYFRRHKHTNFELRFEQTLAVMRSSRCIFMMRCGDWFSITNDSVGLARRSNDLIVENEYVCLCFLRS